MTALPCKVCGGTQRMVLVDEVRGLEPAPAGSTITATEADRFRFMRDTFIVEPGEVCPCPDCWTSAHDLEVAVRWATLSWSPG